MLIRFKVKNYLSFNDEQEFTMLKGKVDKKETHLVGDNNLKILKTSAIYGANASGKSSLVKAMKITQNIIIRGLNHPVNNGIIKNYCKIYDGNKKKTSSFEFEIRLNDKFYAYGFDILLSENSIKGEWLYELDKNKRQETCIFIREDNQAMQLNENYFNKEELNVLKVHILGAKDQDKLLFLTIMNNADKENLYKDKICENMIALKNVFSWIKKSLVIVFPNIGIDNTPYFFTNDGLEKINELISYFETGIEKCNVIKCTIEELRNNIPADILQDIINSIDVRFINSKKNRKNNRLGSFIKVNRDLYFFEKKSENDLAIKKVVLYHKKNNGVYDFLEESDGTQRLFDLLEILINKDVNKTYVIDELGRCFHPALTYEFVRKFIDNKTNKTTQMIFTTHETEIMDFKLLQRDEIWIANRKENAPTELYSLEDYKVRSDIRIDKVYLGGRYGGVPIFKNNNLVNGDDDENT